MCHDVDLSFVKRDDYAFQYTGVDIELFENLLDVSRSVPSVQKVTAFNVVLKLHDSP